MQRHVPTSRTSLTQSFVHHTPAERQRLLTRPRGWGDEAHRTFHVCTLPHHTEHQRQSEITTFPPACMRRLRWYQMRRRGASLSGTGEDAEGREGGGEETASRECLSSIAGSCGPEGPQLFCQATSCNTRRGLCFPYTSHTSTPPQPPSTPADESTHPPHRSLQTPLPPTPIHLPPLPSNPPPALLRLPPCPERWASWCRCAAGPSGPA